MPETPAPLFFVPWAKPDKQEEAYTELAQSAHRPVPEMSERVYSITFEHDGEEWTATVGERLRGHTIGNPSARTWKQRTSRKVDDEAVVLAIFPAVLDHEPYYVVTNSRLTPSIRSAWDNPFMARPKSVKRFDG